MLILAYIDPGSGSLLIQAIVAAALAVPFFFRRTIGGAWRRLRGGRSTSDQEPDGPEPPER